MTDHRTAGQRIHREGEPKIHPMDPPKTLCDHIPTRLLAWAVVILAGIVIFQYLFGDGQGW